VPTEAHRLIGITTSLPALKTGSERVTEDKSDVLQAILDIRVRLDVFEDTLGAELNRIRELLKDSVDVQARSAYSALSDLIRVLESET
jgi:hypothetical protein